MKELKKIYQEYVEFNKIIINGTAPQGMKDLILKLLWLELEKMGTPNAKAKRRGRPAKVAVVKVPRKKFSEIIKESKKAVAEEK
jgi:hypothetical protein